MRQSSSRDLTEAKEAIVEGLVQLTVDRCSGAGREGEFIYGGKPSSRLVSGFLMPRYDSGLDDETSDIRIATMGIDLQLASETSGEVIVKPQLAIYVRTLPTWEELTDRRHDMAPQVQLSREIRRQVEDLARRYITDALATLPPLNEPEEVDERPGDANAEAERKRDAADVAIVALNEQGAGDAEARGLAKAAIIAAERAEQVAEARKRATDERLAARRERNTAIAALRRSAFDRAAAELGIQLRPAGQRTARPLKAEDLAEQPQTEAELPEDTTAAGSGAPADEEVVASGAAAEVRVGAGTLDDQHAAPQPIPQKWKRFSLELGEFRFNYGSAESRQAATAAFERTVIERARATLSAWLALEEGQRDAYRPRERVLPSQFASKEAWERTLAALRTRRPAVIDDILPDLAGLTLIVEGDADYVDGDRINLRVALENGAAQPSKQQFADYEPSVFQVALEVSVPAELHRPLRLDRVQPSYRFADWLTYPAMGLNCGIEPVAAPIGRVGLCTTWAPRYQQPRIEPRSIAGVPTSYAELADPNCDLRKLLALPDAYDAWINEQAQMDAGRNLPDELAAKERTAHAQDIESYRRESRYIRAGIQLLLDSRVAAAKGGKAADRKAIPYEAWLRTNEAFALYGGARFTDWRLFQLAFILAHIATFASRMPEFVDRFDAFRDEESASLLYFSTGGGKSEAFFGLLVYNVFLDRLRGKARGVTALVRYPLRLLTLQQARRLMRILTSAELVRLRRRIPGAPFEIGFWVGSGNTPNRAAQGFGGVPVVTAAGDETDAVLLNPPADSSDAAKAARRRSDKYREALEAYDKLRSCPCCGKPTGMRRYPAQSGRVGIVCFDRGCDWNIANPPTPHWTPLPFLLTDDTIYQRAPSVVLGTIDKLALIGQHDRTINLITGMLGLARYMDPDNKHFHVPRGSAALQKAEDEGWTRLWPAFPDGIKLFHDPFPSLVIQDEGHLLEESLGTFSGLFETTYEAILTRLGLGLLKGEVPTWRSLESGERPRLAKVIAATATISDPDRQLRVLYQREPLRFPCPGPNLYESFYAAPQRPLLAARRQAEADVPALRRPEIITPRTRTYVSIMTNGRSHTMTTSAVVSCYHLIITRLWRLIVEQGRPAEAVAVLTAALASSHPLTPLRRDALQGLLPAAGDSPDILASLLDLQRISLTYVTNKKGGDQIIETLQSQVERDQRADGIIDLPFETKLISGGVTIAEIQDVMRKAEGTGAAGEPFAPLSESLRNIVATSAVSHGVDVDKFNAMFFAGLPSDIAEYIQASSRVGRTHVGFSLLVPTPHSRRDRYVIETHDQFHRFLERMIPPPAVQRWAERAIRRIVPSIMQSYLCGVVEHELFVAAPADEKGRARTFTTAAAIKAWADREGGGAPEAIRAVTEFALEAIGLYGRGDRSTGAAGDIAHYQKFVEDRVRAVLDRFLTVFDSSKLSNFWKNIDSRDMRKPMTSLRDVDAGGTILGATRDPFRAKNVNLETTRQIMRVIRGQGVAARTDVDAEPLPVDVED
jgi:hypothetical protein